MEQEAARSFPVEYAALGLLAESPMHGYELRERLHQALGALWHVATSQLYSVLHRLEERAWVEPQVQSTAGRPARTVYRVTPEGERALDRWLTRPVEHLRDMRVEFLAKVFFVRRHGADAVSRLVDRQIAALAALEAGLAARGRLEGADERFGRIVASFRRHRMRSMIEWLEKSRELLSGTEVER
jgi:PadR family transcriptional regulator AphA